MKKIQLFRTIAAAVIFAVIGVSTFAQGVTAPTGTMVPRTVGAEDIDYATIGSVMPYQVTPDPSIALLVTQGVLNASVYRWSVTGGNTITKQDGSALTAAPAPDALTHFVENLIGIKFPATGLFTIKVQEKSQSAIVGIGGCEDAVGKTLDVRVVAKPTVAWPAVTVAGGCSVAGTTVNVPVNLTGTDQWEVTYKIDYTSLANVTTSFQASTTKTIAGTTALSATAYANTETAATLHAIAIPAATYGTYTVTITDISDRISRKSLTTFGNTAGTEYPSLTYKVYSLPTPATQDIQHLKTF